jgi:predicted O-linked N-acetylglucosamine transferase (SPINDLY family)
MATVAELLSQAIASHQAGNLDQARDLSCRVLEQQPAQPEAWHILGLVAHHAGQNDLALTCLERARGLHSDDPFLHLNLGSVYLCLDQLPQAQAAFEKALALQPDLTGAHLNLGNAYLRRRQTREAAECYRRALRHDPNCALGHNNLGIVHMNEGRYQEAIPCFLEAIRLDEHFVPAHINLGFCYQQQGDLEAAVAVYQKVLEFKPRSPEVFFNLGGILKDACRAREAAACYRRALALHPDWRFHTNLLHVMTFDTECDPDELFAEHCRWGEMHANVTPLPPVTGRNLDPERRLRIGYVSPDFRKHPVMRFIEPILANHDPARVEVFCYAEVSKPDAVTQRLRELVGPWRWTCDLTDLEVAQMVRDDEIDILVDLAGHTADHRLRAFAYKPAPIQASYMGYLNTTGLKAIDYYLTDAVLDPPGEPQRYTEELVRLPHGVACFVPPAESPEVSPLPARRKGHITFGSLHRLHKVTPATVAVWSRVLHAVPEAELLVFWPTMSGFIRDSLLQQFASQGIASERLRLCNLTPPGGYLTVYQEIDIGLDVFPWTGYTTTCETLWMGVPVIGLYGARHSARSTATLLTQVGLADWIARTPEEYAALAARFAHEVDRLEDLRQQLRPLMRETLCNGQRFTRALEDVYQQMWRKWCTRQGTEASGGCEPPA